MKTFFSVLALFVIIWLAKLSYDFYGLSQSLAILENNLRKSEQNNANLNDQLIAVQRKADGVESNPKNDLKAKKPDSSNQNVPVVINPTSVLKPQFELIQFALQEHQFVYALEKLNALDQSIEGLMFADSLKMALHAAIEKDKQSIQQFVLAKNEQKQQLEIVLLQLEKKLIHEQNNQNIELSYAENSHFWKKWFKVDVIDQQAPNIVNRKYILKEAQLRLLLAKQSLEKDQISEYQKMMDLVVFELNQLPDQNSKKIKDQVLKLKQMKIIPKPKLNSFAILG